MHQDDHHVSSRDIIAWRHDPVPAAFRSLGILISKLKNIQPARPSGTERTLNFAIHFLQALVEGLHSLQAEKPATCKNMARWIMEVLEGMVMEIRRQDAERLRPPSCANDKYVWTENDVERDDLGRFASKGGGSGGAATPEARKEKSRPGNTSSTRNLKEESAGKPYRIQDLFPLFAPDRPGANEKTRPILSTVDLTKSVMEGRAKEPIIRAARPGETQHYRQPEKSVWTLEGLKDLAAKNAVAGGLLLQQGHLIVGRADLGNELADGKAGFDKVLEIMKQEEELARKLAGNDAAIKLFAGTIVDLERYGRVDMGGDIAGLVAGTGTIVIAAPGVAASGPAAPATGAAALGTALAAQSYVSAGYKASNVYEYERGRMGYELTKRQWESLSPEERENAKPDYVAIKNAATTYAVFHVAVDLGSTILLSKYGDNLLEAAGVARAKQRLRQHVLENWNKDVISNFGVEMVDALATKGIEDVVGIFTDAITNGLEGDLIERFEESLGRRKAKKNKKTLNLPQEQGIHHSPSFFVR